MTSTALAGSTGLVGSNILAVLANHPAVSVLHAFTRRDLATSSAKLQPLISSNSSKWPSLYPQDTSLFISALGTTRATAGSFENQRKIDYDLNLDLAKAAKEAGATTYVLVSSNGANPNSFFGYTKMKGELEEAIKDLGFEHTVILRPGLIVGQREDSRPPEFALRKVAGFMGSIGDGFKDFWAQDAEIIAKAAVSAGLQCIQGKVNDKVWMLGQSDIVRLGRTQWQDADK
ncbi:hypothetical protein MBLNU459_g5882t1 [Dothideomycetes sp. NU459]